MITRFLKAHPDFRVSKIGALPAAAGEIRNIEELLTSRGFLRTWPHRHGIGGAFVARLEKNPK